MAFLSRIHPGVAAAGAAVAVFAALLFLPSVRDGGDLYWHIAAGRWTLENYAVLRIDPFSYTYAGHPWATQDWLADVMIALAWLGAGWSGVLLLFAAAAAGAAGVVTWQVWRKLAGTAPLAVLGLSFAAAAFGFAEKPTLLALPLFAVWTAGLVDARAEQRAPSFKLLPAMLLWANLEAGFLVGLIVLAVFAVEAGLSSRHLRGWSVFAGFALIAALATPYGLAGILHAARLIAAPLYWDAADKGLVLVIAVSALAALLVLGIRRQKVAPLSVLLLVWLAFMALVQLRHQMLFAVAAPLVLAAPLAAALGTPAARTRRPTKTLFAFAAAVAILAAVRFFLPFERSDGAATPMSALARVPEDLARSPVFNESAFGGYLIFNNIRPYIDDRPGLYGKAFRERYARIVSPDKALLEATLRRYHVRWTILAADDPAAGVMDRMANWHRLYADRRAVVHVRDGVE